MVLILMWIYFFEYLLDVLTIIISLELLDLWEMKICRGGLTGKGFKTIDFHFIHGMKFLFLFPVKK